MTTEEQLRKVLDEVVRQRDDYKERLRQRDDDKHAWEWRWKHDVAELQDEVLRLWDALHGVRRLVDLDHSTHLQGTKARRVGTVLFMLPIQRQNYVPFTHHKDPFHWMRSTNQQWFKELEKLSKQSYLAGGHFPEFAKVKRCAS